MFSQNFLLEKKDIAEKMGKNGRNKKDGTSAEKQVSGSHLGMDRGEKTVLFSFLFNSESSAITHHNTYAILKYIATGT